MFLTKFGRFSIVTSRWRGRNGRRCGCEQNCRYHYKYHRKLL